MKNRLGKFLMGIVLIPIFICGCSIGYEDYSAAGTVMGTIYSASFRAKGAGNASDVWMQLGQAGTSLEQELLSRRVANSEIAEINECAGSMDGCELSGEIEDYLMLCQELSEVTDGAFDVTIGALAELWGIDEATMEPESFVMPTEQDISATQELCGYENVVVTDHRIYLPEGMVIDLGAVGKGIYLSKSYEILSERAEFGIIAAGGSILTYGYKDGGQPWHVGIADPSGKSDVIKNLNLEGSFFVSTSGDYERFVEVDGVKYHHILDTSTGYPAESGLSSVTVVIPADKEWKGCFTNQFDYISDIDISGFMSDAITTAMFVMGEEEGMILADRYELAVVMIRTDGTVVINDRMNKYID